VKVVIGLTIAIAAIGAARVARTSASKHTGHADVGPDIPYTPSRGAAPYVALGFREAAADLLYVRMLGNFNSDKSSGPGIAALAEAIAELDPRFQRIYETGANAMTMAKLEQGPSVVLRAIHLLESGMKLFPADWKLPYLVAGQMYTQDLKSDDAAQKRAWDETGTLLIESAIRKPGAPAKAAAWAAVMRTKLGQHERAVAGLRELLLLSRDADDRDRLVKQLADLEHRDANSVAAEIYEEREEFERTWTLERRTIPISMYILVGKRLAPGFDMANLATGGRDLLVGPDQEVLEPLE
jgi:hypothetical protein